MTHKRNCPFCSSGIPKNYFQAQDHVTGDLFSILMCVDCGGGLTDPGPAPHEMAKYYPLSYYGDSGKKFYPLLEAITKASRRRLRESLSFVASPGRLLEIGCGRGDLLEEFAQRGWEAHGTEYSAAPVLARQLSGNVHIHNVQNLASASFDENSFDLVIVRHVLEHLYDPEGVLEEIARILKPVGRLYLVVPNFGGLVSRIFGSHWFALDVPRHLSHFSPVSLSEICERSGLEILSTSHLSLEQDIFTFIQTFLNAAGFSFNCLYGMIRLPSARLDTRQSNGMAEKLAAICASCLLFPIGFLVSVYSAMVQDGGVIEIRARKVRKSKLKQK